MNQAPRDFPARIGRYEIVERLSAGGMGEVFVARMVGPGGFIKPVALKRIHPHLANDSEFIDMLHDEARLASAVEHPHIVRTVDVGQDGDNHFVVLEFVSGDQVGKIQREVARRQQALPAWLVAWIGARIASALHAVHEARGLDGQPLEIIHRDVSPGNIMLSDSGQPMLVDFGVAKAKQRIHQTSAGELKGKLPYMAPETFLGVASDRSVDIFGLGVVLYELATNVSPFKRQSDIDIITALQAAQVPPPHELRPEIDPRFSAIVMRAMARERADRHAHGAALEAELRAFAHQADVPHDAATAGRWLAHYFPDRIEVRRALLVRVASGAPPAPTPSSPGFVAHPFGPPTHPSAPGGAYVEPTMLLTPTNTGLARPSTDPRVAITGTVLRPGEEPRRPGRMLGAAVVVGALTIGGVAAFAIGRADTSAAAEASPRGLAVESSAAAVGGPAPGAHGDSASGAATSPAANGNGSAAASAEPAASASAEGAASASASASASAAGAAAPPGPAGTAKTPPTSATHTPPPPARKGGPLVREYD